jgi:hypothetical protein
MKRFPIVLCALLVTLAAGCGEVPTSPAAPSSPSFDGSAPPPPVDGEETVEEGKSGSMAVSGG